MSSSVDVNSVLAHKPHKQGQYWTLDVAEYHSDIGLCERNSLVTFPDYVESKQNKTVGKFGVAV